MLAGQGQSAPPILEKNVCQDNRKHGIDFDSGWNLGGVARYNTCSGNEGSGIRVRQHSGVFPPSGPTSLESNICQSNQVSGIAYVDEAVDIARANICSGNKDYGIYVGDKAHPTLEANICTGNGKENIFVDSTARPIFKDEQRPSSHDTELEELRREVKALRKKVEEAKRPSTDDKPTPPQWSPLDDLLPYRQPLPPGQSTGGPRVSPYLIPRTPAELREALDFDRRGREMAEDSLGHSSGLDSGGYG